LDHPDYRSLPWQSDDRDPDRVAGEKWCIKFAAEGRLFDGPSERVHGEFVIMPPWASEIIRDNVLSIDMTSVSRTH
jgi:hypothetical protein